MIDSSRMKPSQVKKSLDGDPTAVDQLPDDLPESPGFYAWWVRSGALGNLPEHPHPRGGWNLLYVGIAPVRATSGQAIRSRVVGNHVRGNTGASTFRLSLAALLFEDRGWQPLRKKRKGRAHAGGQLRATQLAGGEPRAHVG